MSKLFIIVDRLSDWNAYYPTDDLVTAEDFLARDPSPEEAAQVINLCRDYKYLGKGYYCSLLAEARGDRVIPSVRTINDLSRRSTYTLGLTSLDQLLKKSEAHLKSDDACHRQLHLFFGTTQVTELQGLARQLFDLFPCPILEVRFKKTEERWLIESVKSISIHQLTTLQEDGFAAALEQFNRKVWRKSRSRKRYAYDLAMLVDPEEAFPPSSKKALEHFVRAGRRIGIDVDTISKKDYSRLTEYDALFIRETTSVNHHTYKFAQKADFQNMPVIDDPDSILRCANKVYLNEMLRENNIATPRTICLYRDDPDALVAAAETLGFPLVLKVPDGSFSRGIHKVASPEEFKLQADLLFKSSVLVLAQEYMYTDFDWRIGVLGGRPLFACRYYMSEGHWQIYNHGAKKISKRTGKFDTLAVEQAPIDLIKLATKACSYIGTSLYGVDIKQCGDRFSVIEINDNPNVDAGVEDLHLGQMTYFRVMEHFYNELELRRYGSTRR